MKNIVPAVVSCLLFALGTWLSFPILCNASVVYDQPLDPSGDYGFTANYGRQNIFEDFQLDSRCKADSVSWWGLFSSGLNATSQSIANFDILFFTTDPSITITTDGNTTVSGLPELMPFYEYHSTGVIGTPTGIPDSLHGGDIYQWTADIPAVEFEEPGKYWIDIRASSNEADFFLWEHSLSVDSVAVHAYAAEFPLQTWYDTVDGPVYCLPWIVSEELHSGQAFRLDAVPEPATMLLLGFGLTGLAGLRRKFWR